LKLLPEGHGSFVRVVCLLETMHEDTTNTNNNNHYSTQT